jgi:transposase
MEDIQQLLQEIVLLKEQLRLKEEQIERKNERILYLERQLFGRRSEKRLPDYSQAQLTLFDAEQGTPSLEQEASVLTTLIEDIKQKAEQRRNTKKQRSVTQKRSYKLPAHIERRETVIQPERFDARSMTRIGEDVTERLMLDPSKFWVERIVRPVYKIQQEQQALSTTIVQAPLQQGVLPGCIAGSSLLSQIAIDKFLYHIPEYRQAKRFKELGVEITTSSINRWVHALAEKLYPLYIAQMKRVLSTYYIQVDETSHSVTDRPGAARKAYIWVVRSVMSPGIFFHYDKGSRSQEVVLKMLKDYRGPFRRMAMLPTASTRRNRECFLWDAWLT